MVRLNECMNEITGMVLTVLYSVSLFTLKIKKVPLNSRKSLNDVLKLDCCDFFDCLVPNSMTSFLKKTCNPMSNFNFLVIPT